MIKITNVQILILIRTPCKIVRIPWDLIFVWLVMNRSNNMNVNNIIMYLFMLLKQYTCKQDINNNSIQTYEVINRETIFFLHILHCLVIFYESVCNILHTFMLSCFYTNFPMLIILKILFY